MKLSSTQEQADVELRLFALVRDVRVEAINIIQLLDEIEQKNKSADASARSRVLQETILGCSKVYEPNNTQIRELVDRCKQVLGQETKLHAWYGDKFTEIDNLWERVEQGWLNWCDKAQHQISDVDEILAQISQTKQRINTLAYLCSKLTVPDRVNQKLQHLKDGNCLDFNGEFKEELPDEDRRKDLLGYMRSHPLLITGGTVNVEQGIIYRTSRSLQQRIVLLVSLVVAAVGIGLLITGGMYLLGWLLTANEITTTTAWPITDRQGFLSASLMYLFILMGGVSHLAINALKEVRSGETSNSLLLQDWLLWVQVNLGSLIKAIIFLGLALIGFLFIFGNKSDWVSAFFIGYAADSFVDLFLQRFETFASTKTKALQNTVQT